MTEVVAHPALLAAAAADVTDVGSSVGRAADAAARSTTGVVAAAEDEVSAIVAQFFDTFGRDGQSLMARVGMVNDQFALLLADAARGYALAEGEAAGMLAGPVQGLLSSLFGVAQPLPKFGPIVTQSGLVDSILYMSGSGTATPEVAGERPPFIPNVTKLFLPDLLLSNKFPESLRQIAVSTASGLYPFTGTKDLTLNTSLARGVRELTNAINLVIAPGVPGTGNIAVLGYSQSAVVASMAMPILHAAGFDPTQIQFNLLGDPANPNGGLLARFPGLSFQSLGVTLGAATPSNLFPTNVYTLEYDGFADFPQYPINLLADVNALAGILFVHPTYQFLPALGDGYLLQGSASLGNTNSMTDYYLIPSPNLPILAPLRQLPLLGNPLADLIQPNLRALINWGYGDPNYGFSLGPADVPTPFGLLPPLSATVALGPALANGTQAGWNAFVSDVAAVPTTAIDLSSTLANGFTGITAPQLPALPTSIPSALTGLISEFTAAKDAAVGVLTTDVPAAYAALLPTADIATALFVSVPSYDVDLFTNGLTQAINGQPIEGLVHAIGDPIAATTGAATLLIGFEAISVLNSLDTILFGTPHPIPH